jgi:hypothetical protein
MEIGYLCYKDDPMMTQYSRKRGKRQREIKFFVAMLFLFILKLKNGSLSLIFHMNVWGGAFLS